MIRVVLAGNYPEHTYEKLKALLPASEFSLDAAGGEIEYGKIKIDDE